MLSFLFDNSKEMIPKDTPTENNPKNLLEDFLSGITPAVNPAFDEESTYVANTLNDYTLEDFTNPEISDETQQRLSYLQGIVKQIEAIQVDSKPFDFSKQNYKLDYKNLLNVAQLEAVTHVKGPALVIAGAGSGKTRVIVYRVVFLIENGVTPSQILLLTFTRKSAKEMTDRVQVLLQEKSQNNITGGTFHSFANHILRKYSNLIQLSPNFTIIDNEDSIDTIDLIRTELKFNKKTKAFPAAARIQEILSSSRNRQISIGVVIEKEFSGLLEYVADIELICTGYLKYKQLSAILDYDDLMEVFLDKLKTNYMFRETLQREFSYIMVDEFQDTNSVQREIAEILAAKHRNIMVVGDDSQSIYSFRGANFENILRFPESFKDARVIKLQQNYRSNKPILELTNSIIEKAKIGYRKKLFSDIEHTLKPTVKRLFNQEEESVFIVDKIQETKERGVSLGQVAVLCRAAWHWRYVELELNKRGIPYVVVGGLKFSERKHIRDVVAFLRIALNPLDAVAWHRILKLIDGVGEVTAKSLTKQIREKNGELDHTAHHGKKYYPELLKLNALFVELTSKTKSIAAKIQHIKSYYSPILQSREPDFNIRLTDLDVLSDLAQKYSELDKFLSDFALDPPSKYFQDKTTPLIDESEDKAVTISTVHSAKGLEWHTVFVNHALDGLFPSVKALKNIQELEEERRLFYVACSRAKESLYITLPAFLTSYNAFFSYPSRFIVEIDKQQYDQ